MKIFVKTFLCLIMFMAVFYFLFGHVFAAGDHLIINEILVGTSESAKKEFIELYNPTNEDIDMTGFTLKKKTKTGSESPLVSATKFTGIIGPHKYFVIANPEHAESFNANLVYSGASYSIAAHNTILLYDADNNLVDKVGYGEASDYESALATDFDNDISIGRISFSDTDNNSDDFVVLEMISPGAENIKKQESSSSQGDSEATEEGTGSNMQVPIDPDVEVFDISQDIIFSEIFPNPVGLDQDEWIEIYNRGNRNVSLYGWRLSDESNTNYFFPKQTIASKEYLVIKKETSGISLNNMEDIVYLWQPFKDEFLQRVKYEKAPEGESYNYLDYKWIWNNNLTPGEKNKAEHKNSLPDVDFYFFGDLVSGSPVRFDSSDTVDKDKDGLLFFWDFDDGFVNNLKNPEHTFWNNGKFEVKLSVFDGTGTSSVQKEIIIGNDYQETRVLGWNGDRTQVIINEIFPNPEGSENGEFVELFNTGEVPVALGGWQLDDEEGGSKPYIFGDDIVIEPEEYLVIKKEQSKIALNNGSDAVRLFNDQNELVEEVKYENSIEGNTYARGLNGKWFWSTEQTPGEENFIEFGEEYKDNNFVFTAYRPAETEIPFMTIQNIKEREIGDVVSVSGIVAVEPGILGSQYFYIIEQSGIQVYNFKKDFPDLKIGNIIEVVGELSVINDEYRIKTKTKDDIKVSQENVDIEPLAVSCSEINTDMIGGLVEIFGEVIDRKGCSVFLDDGSDEIKIYIKSSTGIDFKSIKSGDVLSVTGIVSNTKSGIRILPRHEGDIEKQEIIVKSAESEVLGEVPVKEEWTLPMRKKTEWYKYLLVIMGGIIIGVGYLKVRKS